MVRRDDLMERTLLVTDEERLEIDDRLRNHLLRAVGRATVRIHQYRSGFREILSQAGTHRLDDMPDGFDIVEARNTDQNIRVGKLGDLRFSFRRQRGGIGSVRKLRARSHTFRLARLRPGKPWMT